MNREMCAAGSAVEPVNTQQENEDVKIQRTCIGVGPGGSECVDAWAWARKAWLVRKSVCVEQTWSVSAGSGEREDLYGVPELQRADRRGRV